MQWNIGKWLSNLKINWVKNDGLNIVIKIV